MKRSHGLITAVVATAAAGLLAACSGSTAPKPQVAADGAGFGTLPAQSGTPKPGGVVRVAESPGAGPNYIFPVTPAANGSVYNSYQFQNLMFRPLYGNAIGVDPKIDLAQSLAALPTYSDGNKTVTIKLNDTYTWSDGKKVDAADVVFFIDVLKAAVKENAANFGNYTPGYFPDSVASVSTPDSQTVVLKLTKAFNPEFFLQNQLSLITPMPSTVWNVASTGGAHLDFTQPKNAKAIYDYLAKQAGQVATYATNPLWQTVDGPWRLTAYNANTSGLTMKPNEKYTGPQKAQIAELQEVAFTSESAQFSQLRSGQLEVGAVPFTDLAQAPTLQQKGYAVYGYPSFGFNYVVFNFHDSTGHFDKIIAQSYVRQALAHLQDEPGLIKGVFRTAAVPSYGPVPAVPKTEFTPADASTNPYPYSIDAASKLLSSHGWKVVPGGQTTCTSPGTGANQCGAGIPAGTPLTWNIYYGNQPAVIEQQVTALISAAKQVGITIDSSSKTFNYLIQNFSVPSAPSNNDKWAMMDFGGFSVSNYPTTNQIFNTTGSYNEGGYSNAQADKLIQASVFGSDRNAVATEASFLSKDVPAIFQPNVDSVYAWSGKLSGPPGSFSALSQYRLNPEYWYFKQ
ncbi:peptide/nickel transport system substrate-binding protein [Friedmanniella endophytica]|uniref:Peptide/nickel transport system substrate-binding protein n=1 Tax=Microlunatus kandeliicorticis TaxID=1759536 RepID=A0A7W3P782_9ACTN|nr:ABC transporter substrate-binding protein [Microlunatus kandeliicorticis]MBA8795702.1 peptide/nickel transport system substrate-binding protein [Microlunatus kandeliicorticis]